MAASTASVACALSAAGAGAPGGGAVGMGGTPWNTMMAQVQTLWGRRVNVGVLRGKNNVAGPSRKTQSSFIESTERYMTARMAGRHDDVLRLVTDDVVLDSSRDGRVEGKRKFGDYLRRVKACGTWQKAEWNDLLGVTQIEGKVKILMLNVNVMARFGFDHRSGKIQNITIGTKKKMK